MYKRHCCVSCDVSDVSHRSARASPSRRAGGEPAVAPRRSCPPAPPRRARIEPERSAGPAGRRREPRGQPTRRTIDSRKDRASCRRHDARLAGRRDRICARRGDAVYAFRTLTSTPANPGYMYAPFVWVKITRFPEVASEATDGFRPFYGRVLSQTPTSIHPEHGCVR